MLRAIWRLGDGRDQFKLTTSREGGPRKPAVQDMLSWLAVLVAIVLFGFVALRLYDTYWLPQPEAPRPIQIFRSPSSHDVT